MYSIKDNPVGYWREAAAAHREHIQFMAAKYGSGPLLTNITRIHESEAMECERKAAEAAAAHAFPANGGVK